METGARDADILTRVRALLPDLRARAAEAAELRRLPDATVAAFQEAGLFRLLQPARWGGQEVDPGLFFDVQRTVATACPSSAWVLGVVAVHAWQLALFPLEAQEEVWGADPRALICSSYAPTGKIERIEGGGYRVSGRWSFSSGCDHCQWAFLGGFVPTEPGAPPDMRTFLLPRREYRIDDTWHVAGLRATGSNDLVVEGALVPEHRTHRLIDGFRRNSPGNAVHPAPLYRLPFGQIFVRSVSTAAIGAAEGALAAYCDAAARRLAATDGGKVAEDPATQGVAARAAAAIDEAQLVLHRNFDEMMALARASAEIPLERRVRFRYDSANAVAKCLAVVDELFAASGGRAIFLNNPIQRYFQDIHAARAHYANNPEKPARNFGGVLLKLKNQDYFI